MYAPLQLTRTYDADTVRCTRYGYEHAASVLCARTYDADTVRRAKYGY